MFQRVNKFLPKMHTPILVSLISHNTRNTKRRLFVSFARLARSEIKIFTFHQKNVQHKIESSQKYVAIFKRI